MKKCKYRHCDKEVTGRKQYCSDSHKWRENSIRKDEEKHLPPVKKRTKEFFYMSTGSQPNSLRGHGRKRGAMAARVYIETVEFVPVTYENILRHFAANNGYHKTIRFGDQTTMPKEEALQKYHP